MKTYQEMTREELLTLQQQLTAEYNDAKAKGLKLDMSRGKPAAGTIYLDPLITTKQKSRLVQPEKIYGGSPC